MMDGHDRMTEEHMSRRDVMVDSQGTEEHKSAWRAQSIIYYLLGILEVVLGFRFVLKLLGANPESGFVDFVYGLSGIFVAPFNAIFTTPEAAGNVVKAVMEPATLIAMLVYFLLVLGVVRLIDIFITEHPEE